MYFWFNFLRNYQIIFQSGCHFTFPSAMYEGSSSSTPWTTLVTVFFIVATEVVSHCDFGLNLNSRFKTEFMK